VCHVSAVSRLRTCADGSGVVAVSWQGVWGSGRGGGGRGGYLVELVQDNDALFGGPVSAFHVHQGAVSAMQIIELVPRDLTLLHYVVITPCWVASESKKCFHEFSSVSAKQPAVRRSSDSRWCVRLAPAVSTRIIDSFLFSTQCTSLQFQSSFALVLLPEMKSSYPLSTSVALFPRDISSIIVAFSNVSSSSHLAISCVTFLDVGVVCGTTILIPEAWRGNASFVSLLPVVGPKTAIVKPQSDNSALFIGLVCGNESIVNISMSVVPLRFNQSLLILQLRSSSASVQLPFTIPSNFSSGRVSFATSSSPESGFVADFVEATLHCADTLSAASAISSFNRNSAPTLIPMPIDRAIFALVPSVPATSTDACWSQPTLSDLISGRTFAVDGSWSLFDNKRELHTISAVLQVFEAHPIEMKRDTSMPVVVVIGSTMVIEALCDAPSCIVTWLISKHFDLEITNTSNSQKVRFNPRPHHGGGKFRV
jgi:hypothetical protein